jgi:hypothetical protein
VGHARSLANVSNYIPATVYLLTVTPMKWNGEYLAVSNNDQFSIIVITVLWLVWGKTEKRNWKMFFLEKTLKLGGEEIAVLEKLQFPFVPTKEKSFHNISRFYTSFNLKAI